jgi:hypothetical protein
MYQTTDVEIRSALHKMKLRRDHRNSETLVIDELGLAHGKGRVDIAVLNGWLHGYEIKSSRDTTRRLETQIELYAKCLEKVTVVSAESHIDDVMKMCPEYFGVVEVRKGERGGLNFKIIRKEQLNPDVDPYFVAHLLWKEEALKIASDLNIHKASRRLSRQELYRLLSTALPERELYKRIKSSIMARDTWRDPQRLVSYDDSYQLTST